MKLKLLLTALVLGTAPGLAMAACSGYGHQEATMSCPEGQAYDAATSSCQPTPTG
ncbi:MAG: adenylosuccinate lyase [Paracoccaceae bacterium]|nr:adenylosuccinate lyase [Paracoccaceae bacterium]